MLKDWLNVPRINDITTTPDAPPEFRALKPSAYPKTNAPLQKAAYPDLAPVDLGADERKAFEKVVATARSMKSWEIAVTDGSSLRLEAVATTPLLRFKDDIVVELRSGENGRYFAHIRSRSRLGKSDLGANAARIRVFSGALKDLTEK